MFLNCHSWFSFQYGLMGPEELLRQAQASGVRTIALTDIHNTGGVLDFVRLAPRFDVRPVVGIEFRQGARLLYIGVAKNNAGFQQLNELLSPHLLDGEAIPEHAPAMPDVFFILPFNTAPRILHPNERIGIKPSDLTRLALQPLGETAQRPGGPAARDLPPQARPQHAPAAAHHGEEHRGEHAACGRARITGRSVPQR